MLRALAPYLIVCLVIGVTNGVLLGTEVIGVAGFYGLVTLGCAVGIFGYVRWDKQHYG